MEAISRTKRLLPQKRKNQKIREPLVLKGSLEIICDSSIKLRWEKQPLVLVNYGQATGEDIYAMAQDVRLRVKNCFGVKLEPEVAMV